MITRSDPHFKCDRRYSAKEVEVDSHYENKQTTLEELALIEYFKNNSYHVRDKNILHVGTGNSTIVNFLYSHAKSIDTITISRNEILSGLSKLPSSTIRYLFLNKYNIRELSELNAYYDIIIDVNLKSFACCEFHFLEMIEMFISTMHKNSELFTAMSGVNFGWNGNTSISYTPGASPLILENNFRILGEKGIQNICQKYDLSYKKTLVHNVWNYHGIHNINNLDPIISDEEILIIKKNQD